MQVYKVQRGFRALGFYRVPLSALGLGLRIKGLGFRVRGCSMVFSGLLMVALRAL